jgi:hypothetical protein
MRALLRDEELQPPKLPALANVRSPGHGESRVAGAQVTGPGKAPVADDERALVRAVIQPGRRGGLLAPVLRARTAKC